MWFTVLMLGLILVVVVALVWPSNRTAPWNGSRRGETPSPNPLLEPIEQRREAEERERYWQGLWEEARSTALKLQAESDELAAELEELKRASARGA
jgi:hypothetical protein